MVKVYPVAKQIGTPFACRCLIKRLTPMIDENDIIGHRSMYKHGINAYDREFVESIATRSIEFGKKKKNSLLSLISLLHTWSLINFIIKK